MVKTIEFENKHIRIDVESRVPKYRQIVDSIIEDIERGLLQVGDRVPSINEISEEYGLSRDTVEKAYNELKKRQIIVSSKGKGYYVARCFSGPLGDILFLANKLSWYKLQIYNAFVSEIGGDARVDLCVYHCDPVIFAQMIQEKIGHYDQYVVMPHFKDEQMNHQDATPEIIDLLQKLPQNKLLLIDNVIPALGSDVRSVHQDFKTDLYDALCEGLPQLKLYKKLILVFPRKTLYPFPSGICAGFRQFSNTFGFDCEIIDQVYPDMEIKSGDAYIIIEENDLVNLMNQMREKNLVAGSDIGIVSYNDTPLKALLGITVISTDFSVMGETAAYMIKKGKKEVVKNVFSFINRNSI